jgi:hypothetical protein
VQWLGLNIDTMDKFATVRSIAGSTLRLMGGWSSQGADRREALAQAWREIREIEAAYFLRELSKPAPKPAPPKRTKRPRRLRSIVLVAAVILLIGVVSFSATHQHHDVEYQTGDQTIPALPWYCDVRIAPSGDNAARALRDCPQFAKYRAESNQLTYAGCARGLPAVKPIWSGLPDSPPDPTC